MSESRLFLQAQLLPDSVDESDRSYDGIPWLSLEQLSFSGNLTDSSFCVPAWYLTIRHERAIPTRITAFEDFFSFIRGDSQIVSQCFTPFDSGRPHTQSAFSPDKGTSDTAERQLILSRCTPPVSSNQRVVSVACGLQHVLLCTDVGQIFSCGINHHGQLGTGRLSDEPAPVLVSLGGRDLKPVRVFAGYNFSFALAVCTRQESSGKHQSQGSGSSVLLAWGCNQYGQLGVGSKAASAVPIEVRYTGTPSSWVSVAGGFGHAAAISSDGRVYCFGLNLHGQLGLSSTEDVCVPHLVPIWERVKQVSCGTWHTLFLTENGEVLTAGCLPKFASPPALQSWSAKPLARTGGGLPRRAIGIERLRYKPSPETGQDLKPTQVPLQSPFADAPGISRVTGLPPTITSVSAGPLICAALGKDASNEECLYMWRADVVCAIWDRKIPCAHICRVGRFLPANVRERVSNGTVSMHCHAGASGVFTWLATDETSCSDFDDT